MEKKEKEKLLLMELAKFGAATANEVIDRIFRRDLQKGYVHPVSKGWRFYVHLNKHFVTLKRNGMIKQRGFKKGESNIYEKVWIPTPKTLKLYYKAPKAMIDVKDKIKSSIARMKANRELKNKKRKK